MKNSVKALKRLCALLLAILMTVTSFPTQSKADDIFDNYVEDDYILEENYSEANAQDMILEDSIEIVDDTIDEDMSEYMDDGETNPYSISISYNGTCVSNVRYYAEGWQSVNPGETIPYNDTNKDEEITIRFDLSEDASVLRVEYGYVDSSEDEYLTYKETTFHSAWDRENTYVIEITPYTHVYDEESNIDKYVYVKDIRIIAGIEANITFDKGYDFSHVYISEWGGYDPIPNEEKPFDLTQKYIEGEEFYVAVDTFVDYSSDAFKLVSIDESNVVSELEMVDSYGTRTGSTRIYKIIAKDKLRIGEERNFANTPKTVTIDPSGLKTFTVDVVTGDNVVKKEGTKNTYIINSDGTLDFTVHRPSGKSSSKAVMEIYGDDTVMLIPNIENFSAGKVDYKYSVNYVDLFDGKKISISEDIDIKTISFTYPEGHVAGITVKENGEEITPVFTETKNKSITADYEVSYGSKMEYSISSNSAYIVGCVYERTKDSERTLGTVRSKKDILRRARVISEDMNVDIEPQGIISAILEVKASDGNWIQVSQDVDPRANRAQYTMFEGSTYRLTLKCGDELLKDGLLSGGKGSQIDWDALDGTFYVRASGKSTKETHYLTADSENKTSSYVFTVGTIQRNERTGTIVTNGTSGNFSIYDRQNSLVGKYNLKLNISPMASAVSATNHSYGVATCEADSNTVLKIKSEGSKIKVKSFSIFDVEVTYTNDTCRDCVAVEFVPAKGIVITPKPEAANLGEVAKVKLYRKDRKPGDSDYYIPVYYKSNVKNKETGKYDEINYEEIKINVTSPIGLENYKADVKKIKTDDTSLYLKFTSKYDTPVKKPVYGAQYYEIKAVPKDGVEKPADVVSKTIYLPRNIDAESEYFDEQYNTAYDAYLKKYEAFEGDIPEFVEPKYKDYVVTEKVKISNAEEYFGHAWDYDVTVTLVQSKDKNVTVMQDNADSQIAFRGVAYTEKMSTMAPTYETNLKLSKNASKVFTGQQNVKVATIGYSASTGSRGSSVEDITECADSEKLNLKIVDDVVYADVNEGCFLGNHTIQVTPVGPATMHQNAKTVVISVVQGIDDLKIVIPSDQIYKKSNGTGTLTATVVYNDGKTAPNVKKVKWELASDTSDSEYDGKNVTISNGKVTVNKNFNSENDFGFRIKVTAADYAGNTTCAYSDIIEVTDEAMTIAALKFASYDEATDCYKLCSEPEGNAVQAFTTKQLSELYLIAFKESPEDRDEFTTDELKMYAIAGNLVKITSSNKNAAAIEPTEIGYKITSNTVANNVTFTATTTDGGNKKNTKKINVVYAAPYSLALKAKISGNIVFDENYSDEASSYWTQGSLIDVQLRQKDEESSPWADADSMIKHTVSIKGGKIVKKDLNLGKYSIITTGETATITLKDAKNNKQEYKIKNLAYSPDKSPSVKVGNSIVMGVKAGRQVKLTSTVKAPYTLEGKVVKVELDAEQKLNVKNAANYTIIENSCNEMNKYIDASSEMYLNFDETSLNAGKYKVWLTFGTKNKAEEFVADAKPVAITITVAKPVIKKGVFNLLASISIEKTKGASVEITGKGNVNYIANSVSINSVKNANIKGKSNDFLKYFDVVTTENDGVSTTKVVLKSDLSDADLAYITGKSSKNDRLCEVTYTYKHGDDGYGRPYTQTKTSRIEVKFK